MEVKKTEKASLKGLNMLYFLIGVNGILLLTYLIFSYKQYPPKPVEVEEEVVEVTSDVVIIDIPEPETPPPPPPPQNEPPPPPPPEIPTEIEETPEEVPPPPIQDQNEPKPIDVPKGPVATGPVTKVDLSNLKPKEEKKEERVAEPVTVNRVKDMAVYPGCEKKKGDKRKLIKCFGEKLGKDILRYLDTEFPDIDKDKVVVRLEFNVDTNGHIINVNPKMGDDIFKPEAKRAMQKVAEYLKRKNKLIEPARMADGSKAILIFTQNVALANPDA